MDNSCKLKLEWVPAAYMATDKSTNDTSVSKLRQAQPVNGIYQSNKRFVKNNAYKKKP
jgi:hypothetical protein